MKQMAILAAALGGIGVASAAIPTHLKVCDDRDEWPPYIYYKREAGNKTREVAGFSVDYLKLIFEKRRISFEVALMPWKRCLLELVDGESAMLANASRNAERDRDYLVSKPYYELTGIYFYAKSRAEPKVENIADLKRYKVCGQAGYNYQNFGFGDKDVDVGTSSFSAAMEKLKLGHCDAVLAQLEIVSGDGVVGRTDFLRQAGFAYRKVPGMSTTPFHMMVSRKLPYANELLGVLDQSIDELKGSKEVEGLRRKYFR